MSFWYSLMLALVGGTAPLMDTWLVTEHQLVWTPEIWLALLGVVCLATLLPMRDVTDRALTKEKRHFRVRSSLAYF